MWNRLWHQPVSQSRLRFLTRIVLLMLAADAILLMLPRAAVYGQGDFNVTHFGWLLDSLPGPTSGLYIGLMVAVAILSLVAVLGRHNRWLIGLITLLYTYAWSISLLDSYQHHYFLSWVLLCITLFPTPDPQDARPRPAWSFQLLAAVVAIVYCYTAITKLDGGWLSGKSFALWLGDSWLQRAVDRESPAWRWFSLAVIVSEFVLAIAYAYCVFAGEQPRKRLTFIFIPALVLSFGLHVGVELIRLSIGWFSYYMLGLGIAYFAPRHWLHMRFLQSRFAKFQFGPKLMLGFRWTLAIAFVALLIGCSDVTFRFWLIRGQDLRARGHLEAAETALRMALRWKKTASQKDRVTALTELGLVLTATQRSADMLAAYDEAIKLSPKDATLHYHKGNLLLSQEKLEAAEKDFQRATELDNGFLEAWHNLGVTAARLKHADDAIRAFQRATAIDDRFLGSHLQLGKVQYHLKADRTAAQKSFERVVELDKDHIEGQFLLGAIYDLDDQLELAAKHYSKAIALRPRFLEAILNLAGVQQRRGKREWATRLYRQIINLAPTHPIARRAAEALGDP